MFPNVTFPVREGNTWKKLTSDDIFKNKTVVVFSLPGAFTPTCSSTHLPRYNELAPAFFKEGVDSIVCVSVNDTFVMNEWAKDQESANITLLPDGNGAFTEGMGMLVDKSDLGFGKRSWRYSMLVKDGVVQKMFIEPEKEGDPFEVSDADTMLAYFAPKAKKPDQVVVFSAGLPVLRGSQGAAAGQGFRSDRDPAGEQGPRPRHRRRLGQGHRAAGVHQRLADRRPGRPEGALRLTGIRHAGPGRPGMPRGSAPCVVEPARRIPAARVPARPRPGAAGTVASRARAARRIRPRQDTAQPRHIGSTWI